MDTGQAWGLREVIVAMLGSNVVSALLTASVGYRLSRAQAKKVTFDSIKSQHEENADVERVINERIKIIFEANEGHIRFLTEEIGRLRRQVENLSAELHEARVEISQLRDVRSQPAHVPPSDVAGILNQDF